jgi:SulP family sulfate permease
VLAGLTVGVVALPLALAFGIATGVGPATGLVTAVVAGAVAAVFGGSNVQVTGPTGAMTVVLAPLVARDGRAVVFPLAVIAGLVILVGGVVGAGRLLVYVPWPLVEGFTLGIAVIIAAQEVPSALGVPKPAVQNALGAAVVAVGDAARHPRGAVIGLLIVTIAVMVGVARLHRGLPSGLIAVVVVTAIAEATHASVARIGSLPTGLPVPSIPTLSGSGNLVAPALVVAFLGALESALSAKVADGMSDGPRHDTNRELFGQGLANAVAGCCGGMPATGAIARTAVNVRAGAHTRVAALVHAVVLALIVFAGSRPVGAIPMGALAGVLLVTAYRMVEPRNIRAVLRSTRSDAAVFAVTAVATVAFDLVRAVIAGLVLAAILTLVRISRSAAATVEPLPLPEVDDEAERALLGQRILVYRLDGPLHFGVVARFLNQLLAISDVDVVILRTSGLGTIDGSGARALGEIVDELSTRGIVVLVKGLTPAHSELLDTVGALHRLDQRDHLFATLDEAIAHAQHHVLTRHETQPATNQP